MWVLLLEALLALLILVFMVAWTMWPKRKEFGDREDGPGPGGN